jgi:hypothetical protein
MAVAARPLQILLEKVSVTISGDRFLDKLYVCTVRLRCWPAGATVPADPTFIDEEVSADYLANGTVDDSLTEWGKEIKRKCQRIIDRTILEDSLCENSKLGTAITQIQGTLTG